MPIGSERIRVLIADDHEIIRAGLGTLLVQVEDFEVVGEAACAVEAVALAQTLMPDVVLMDVGLPDRDAIEAFRTIKAVCPDTRVIVLIDCADAEAVSSAVFAGADGCLLKEIGTAALMQAIRTVAGGQSILDAAGAKAVLNGMRSTSSPDEQSRYGLLSEHERRMLALLAEGKTNKEIASNLKLSEKAVKNRLTKVYQKLQVTRRSQAAALFARRTKR